MTLHSDTATDLPLVLGGNVFGWTADKQQSFAVLDAFVEAGGRLIDTADSYMWRAPGNSGGESETIIGEWFAARGNRDQIFVATKVGSLPPYDNLRGDTITTEVENSLRRLRTDHIDLYWAHKDDADTPQEETLAAFDSLVKAGKVRHIGASNFTAERLTSALAVSADAGLASYEAVQPHYNVVEAADFETTVQPVAVAHGLITWPYYALASGFLTGKYRPGQDVESTRSQAAGKYLDARGERVLTVLDEVAADHEVSVAAVSLAWLNQQDTVRYALASARTPEQFAALSDVRGLVLTEAQEAAIRDAASS